VAVPFADAPGPGLVPAVIEASASIGGGIERISGKTGILSTLQKRGGGRNRASVANLAALASFAAASTIAA